MLTEYLASPTSKHSLPLHGRRPLNYTPRPPRGRPVHSDPHFTLMADADGVGFIHCGDAVVVVPLTDEGDVLLAVEYSPAFGHEVLTLVSGSIEAGMPRFLNITWTKERLPQLTTDQG